MLQYAYRVLCSIKNIEEDFLMVEEIKKEEAVQEEGGLKALWAKMQETVSPVIGWAVFGGVLVLAVLLGLLICL